MVERPHEYTKEQMRQKRSMGVVVVVVSGRRHLAFHSSVVYYREKDEALLWVCVSPSFDY